MTRKPTKGAQVRRLATATALILAAGSANAAIRTDLHQQDVKGINAQYKAASASLGVARSAAVRHAEMIGLDAESALSVLRTDKDKDGTIHTRYQQTFRGLPVFGEHVVVSEQNGAVRSLFGRKVDRLAVELSADAVSQAMPRFRALALARAATLGAREGVMRTERVDTHLVVFVDAAGKAHLAHQVSFFADAIGGGQPTRPLVLIDARSGAVLFKVDQLAHALVGTGPGGNAKTGQYEWGSGGKYGYMDVTQSGTTCTMNNAKVKGVNLNGGTSGTTAFSYTCPRNTVKTINGAYSPLNDAFQFGGVITNMYPAYTGYNALTFQLVMRTHYSSNYENAFWDGATMSFGDGASTFYPLVNADVSGHEVSHGFTEQHSNLTYSGQSGGMNEAFSDMGGEATEFYWQGSNDFLVGAEIFKGAAGQALRYMANPPQDGGSIDNASQYNSGLDVHYSSGVYNKAFYLLATKPGWSVPTAFKVMARANALYWTPSSTFNSGACGVETAATDLGLVKADVTAAFASVGVSCSGGGGGGDSVGGPLTKGVAITGIHVGTAGNSVTYTLSVPAGSSNLVFSTSGGTGDMDMYVKAGSAPTDSSYDCRPYANGNTETCTIAAPVAGTYYVRMKAYSAFTGVTLNNNYTTGGGGGGTTTYSNTADYTINDNSTVDSPIVVSGRTGNAPTNAVVTVAIVHTYQGDLKVDLVAPDGSLYNIHNRTGGSADNVNKTVTFNLSTEALNGTWKLRVNDNAGGDVGKIDSWSIKF